MRKSCLFMVLGTLMACLGAKGQGVCPSGYGWLDTIVLSGVGNSTYVPLGTLSNSSHYYHTLWTVYTREEIEEVGIYPGSKIKEVGWQYMSTTGYGAPELNIYMKEVPVRSVEAATDSIPLDSMTLVYTSKGSGAVTFLYGWNYIQLDTVFEYSGHGHLMIAVQRNGGAGGIAGRTFRAASGKSVSRYKSQFGTAYLSDMRTGNGRAALALRACAGPDVCPRPEVQFTATENSITVHLGEHDSLYHVVLGSVGFQPDTVGMFSPRSWLAWDDTVRYDMLNSHTKYDIYVRQRCGDYYSLWSGPHTISTFCGVQPLPYNFHAATNVYELDSCWMLYNAVGISAGIEPRTLSQDELDSGVVVTAVAVLPRLDAPINRLNFTYGGRLGLIELGVMTDAYDTSTFISYDTLDLSDWGVETDFSRYHGPEGRVAVRWHRATNGSVGRLSNVTVDTVPGCYAPYQVMVDSVVDTTAYVSWRNRVQDTVQWVVSYSTHPTDSRLYTTVVTDTTTLQIDSLLPRRYYYLHVRTMCEDSVMSGYARNTLKFLTECRPIDRLPYRMDATMKKYTSGEMPCWTEVTDTATNLKYFISPRFDTTAVRMDQLKLTVDYGYTHAAMLRVGLMDDASDLTSFVPFDSLETVAWRNVFYNNVRYGCHIAFCVSNNAVFRLDTLIVEHNAVHPVADLHRTACTPTSITMDWTEQGQATEWLVRCYSEEDGVETAFVATSKPATISGLQPYSALDLNTYNISVCAIHGGDTSLPVQGRFSTAPDEHHTALRIETDTLGSATSTYQPFNRTNKHTWTQILYPMTEYGTAGWIDTVWFHSSSRINLNVDQDTSVTLYMGISDFDHAEGPYDWVPEERLHRVWHGRTLTADSNNMWVPIVLDTAFYYDGQGALALVFSRSFHQQYYSFDSYHYSYKQQGVVMYRAGADTTFAQYPSTIGSRNGTLYPNLPVARFSFYTSDCHNVDSLRVVSTSFDSVTLAWHAQGDEQQWQVVYWAEDGYRDSVMVSGAPQTTITSLFGSQKYWFRVRPVCDTADTGLFYGLDSCHVVSCPQPDNLSVMTVGDSSATLVWDGMSATQQGQIVVYAADGSWGDTMAVTGTQTTLSGLLPRTYYVAKVQGVCGTVDTSAYSPTLTFRTTGTGIMYHLAQVGKLNAPHISGPAPIEVFWKHGWSQTIYEADSIGTYGYIDTLWYYAEQVGTEAFDTSVTIFMGHTPLASHPSDSAWLQASDLTQVYHSSSVLPSDTGWFPIVLNPPFEYNGRDNLAVAISYQATNWTVDWKFAYYSNMPYYYLRRGHDSDASYSSHPGTIPGNRAPIMPIARFSMAVDTIAPPFCLPTHNLHVEADSTGAESLVWGHYPADSLYQCSYWSLDGTDGGQYITNLTTMPLSRLLPRKVYQIEVQTLCSTGELTEGVMGFYATPCSKINELPFADGFENAGWDYLHVPHCWQLLDDGDLSSRLSETNPRTGGYCLRLYADSASSPLAVLPEVDTTQIDLGSVLLSLWAVRTDGADGSLVVGTVITSGGSPSDDDTITFTPLDTVAVTDEYARYLIPFTHYEMPAEGHSFIAIKALGSSGNILRIDDVELSAIPAPEAVVVESVLAHEAVLSIVDSNVPLGYSVLVSSWDLDDSLFFVNDVSQFTMQGLQPATTYCVWVRSEFDGYHSRWTGPTCLTTLDEIHYYTARGVSDNPQWGEVEWQCVEGCDSLALEGLYAEGCVIVFEARPFGDRVRFANWNDGNGDNPRRVVLTQDTVLTAHFEEIIGIDDVADQGVTVWPNPASGIAMVGSRSLVKSIECMDAAGRCVAQYIPYSLEYKIDVSGWQTGMYYIKVITEEGCSVLKLAVRTAK
ncbi:MAG: T9SS type A sorting domain-containing protein [Bacteroidales bacterium]|nr:T9SS type A sorting domain-containing protein [Bacteroidales bacterium]